MLTSLTYIQKLTCYFDNVHNTEGLLTRLGLFDSGWRERASTLRYLIDCSHGQSILDIGCGSGETLNESIDSGVDFICLEDLSAIKVKQAMTLLSAKSARIEGSSNDVFHVSDQRKYDVVVMLGVTDYYADWVRMIKCSMVRSKRIVIVDFPRSSSLRIILRTIWLRLHGFKVYSINKASLETLLSQCITARQQYVILETKYNWMVKIEVL